MHNENDQKEGKAKWTTKEWQAKNDCQRKWAKPNLDPQHGHRLNCSLEGFLKRTEEGESE